MCEDNRIPAIDEGNRNFIIMDRNGRKEVALIEVIGRGGSCLAYKAEKKENGGATRAVVVKEYYPQESGVLNGLRYKREAVGKDIILESTDETSTADQVRERREKEIQRQRTNVRREVEITNELAYDSRNVENNPYAYYAEEWSSRGDSTYVIIDTNHGCTLRRLLRDHEGKIGIPKAITYTKELLYVAEQMLFKPENSFCHADIKPENIYLEGMDSDNADAENNGVPRIILLDFGSVFHPQDYQLAIDDVNEITEKEIKERADKILYNEGIGCSTDGYRSKLIHDVYINKGAYNAVRSFKYAKRLVGSINKIDNSVDIFSIVQCFFEMAVGEPYPFDIEPEIRDFEDKYKIDFAVAEQLIKIGNTNKSGYKTTAEINADLDELSAILNRDAIPQVLLAGVNSKFKGEYENSKIDEGLFGNISFE